MKICPECKQLRLATVCCITLGIFPWQFVCPDQPTYQNIYRVYSHFPVGYFMCFLIMAYVELIKLFREEVLRVDEILRNTCVTLLCTVTMIRLMIMRLKPHIRNLMQEIIDNEKYTFRTYDQTILNIYKSVVNTTNREAAILFILNVLMTIMHQLRTFAVVDLVKRGNETVTLYTFPVSAALPFHEQEHFWAAYNILMTMAINAASFMSFIDLLIFSLIMYSTGQLKVMHHILKNFDEYKEKVKNNLEEDVHEELLSEITFKQCINMHRTIIKYIKKFNACMSLFMVFDFLQTSLQLAAIMGEMVLAEFTLYTVSFVISFLSSSIYRLYMFYYYANEVLYLSESLPLSLWQSNWYLQPRNVKYMIRLFILRCRTPLVLTIGPFGQMTLSTFLSILQASYSYFTLIYSTQH